MGLVKHFFKNIWSGFNRENLTFFEGRMDGVAFSDQAFFFEDIAEGGGTVVEFSL